MPDSPFKFNLIFNLARIKLCHGSNIVNSNSYILVPHFAGHSIHNFSRRFETLPVAHEKGKNEQFSKLFNEVCETGI